VEFSAVVEQEIVLMAQVAAEVGAEVEVVFTILAVVVVLDIYPLH
jgi:predicted peroxiredoxin